jgi:ABC-2 type transport system ATP-binding protein
MATPYLDEAERCTRVALLHDGRLLAMDRPGALRESLPGDVLEVIVDDHRRGSVFLRSLTEVVDVQMFGERAHVRLHPGAARPIGAAVDRLTGQLRAAGFLVEAVRPVATALEDVFIAQLGSATLTEAKDVKADS